MNILEFARDRVQDMRAADGGLTWAAGDVTHLGRTLQRLYDAGDFEAIKGFDTSGLGSEELDVLGYAVEHIPTEE